MIPKVVIILLKRQKRWMILI